MRIIHLSDLHLGKRVNEFPMLEEQKYILGKILEIIDINLPQAVIIAGDVYDKPVPPADAVAVLDGFLAALAARGLKVFIISGNHDSAERIAFGGRLMERSGIYISPAFSKPPQPVTLEDCCGSVNFYMLPFIKPAHVRALYPDKEISSYTDAVRTVTEHMQIDGSARNVLITHQFVSGAERCDSEDISVGGADNVDASVFDVFDYVALGHLHRPQSAGRSAVRYCGSPLKYSFSECDHVKSVSVIDLNKKGSINITTAPLAPLHDMRQIKGSYSELTLRANYINTNRDDYLHITLTDEDDIPDAVGKLRVIYPNIMKLDYDNARTRAVSSIPAVDNIKNKKPIELFADFYELRNNRPMTAVQREFMERLTEEIWEGTK